MPSDKSLNRIRIFVEKYLAKTGTSRHPNLEVTDAVVNGLAANIDELGRPLCPCKFFPDKQAEVERSREWICACDDMKRIWPKSSTSLVFLSFSTMLKSWPPTF